MNILHNTAEFQDYILRLLADNEINPRTLDEYLFALLKRLEQAGDVQQPTLEDIAAIIHDAFTGEPAVYDKAWEKLPEYTTEINSEAYHAEIRSHEWQVRHLKLHLVLVEKLRKQGHFDSYMLGKQNHRAKVIKDFYWTNFDINSYFGKHIEFLSEIEPGDEEFVLSDWLVFSDLIDEGPGYQDDLYD